MKQKKKPEDIDKEANLISRWRYCSLSQEPLQTPIVMCMLGYLYNKTAVIEMLLDKTVSAERAHIKTLKSVKELKLTPNPEHQKLSVERHNTFIAKTASAYICPIAKLEMNGRHRFVALWSCGCVFSEKALLRIKDSLCLCCVKPFSDEDIVILNGGPSDIKKMEEKVLMRKLKKDAKRRRLTN